VGLDGCRRARVSAWQRERRKWGARVCFPVFIRSPIVVVELVVNNGGRDVSQFVAVSTSRASSDGDEDDDVFSSISTRRVTWAGVGLLLGPRGWTPAGPVVGLLRSGEIQVSPSSFSLLLFSGLYFYFEFRFEFIF
jgi:hypothetical protein